MRHRAFVVAVAASVLVLAAIAADLTPLLRGPAPYPPEWRWDLRREPAPGSALPALACGLALVALLAAVDASPGRRTAGLALAAAVPLGFAFQLALLAVEPGGALQTLARRTVSRTVTSYYTVALSPMAEDPWEFVARHHELLPEMRHGAKHASTHPPGPVLFYRGLLGYFDDRPHGAERLLAAAGLPEPERRPVQRATALAGPLLILFACALTAWPLAALARGAGLDEAGAARAGILWTLLPGPALMAPQFDQALALAVTSSAAALAAGASCARGACRVAWGLAAGVVAAAAFFFSYGAPVLIAVTCAAALAAVAADRAGLRRSAASAGAAVLAAAGIVGATVLAGHRPWRSAAVALAIHREDFTAPRSYALWLLFNPLDLALFAGIPVAVTFVARVAGAARGLRSGVPDAPGRFTLAAAAGLAVLLLSGTVRGEVGRIWIPAMPLLLVPAASRLQGRWHAAAAGALLLVFCVVLRLLWDVG